MKHIDPIITLMVVALLIITITGAYLTGHDQGKEVGAKIALALELPTDYRAEEVRGSCETLFEADECRKCHDFE
jgi:hypothetical protein